MGQQGGAKPPERRRRLRETNPEEWRPRTTECQVEMGQGMEETENSQPPRWPPLTGPSKAQLMSMAYWCQRYFRAARRKNEGRRGATGIHSPI